MNYEKLKEALTSVRTTRRFEKDFEVTKKDLKELVDLARVTSSAKNAQPIKYILVTKKEDVLTLARNSIWAGSLTEWTQSKDERPSAFMVMLNDKNIDGFPMIDAGIALTAIGLGAKAKGLSICPLASTDKKVCKELFNISDNFDIIIGIAVGKGAEDVKIVDVKDENTEYFRDKNKTHFVPKRALKDIIVGEF